MAGEIRGVIAVARSLERNPFAFAPVLTIAIVIGPILVGLLGTLAPAFGLHPALGAASLSVRPFSDMFADPSFATALRVTIVTGFGATLLSVIVAFSAVAALHGTRAFRLLQKALGPALAFPYASFAVGFAFLFSPSGWIVRLISPWLTGWTSPPDLLILRDPDGITLMIALMLKESLFLVLMIVAAIGQTQGDLALRTARSMGYGRVRAWMTVIFPQIYAQIRLPVYAVLAASLSVVDVAVVIGPTAPPPLAPLTLGWYRVFEVSDQMKAAAASVFQLALAAMSIAVWRGGEILFGALFRPALSSGRRSGPLDALVRGVGFGGAGAAILVSFLSILVLTLWSFAATWRWPGAAPQALSLAAWSNSGPTLWPLVVQTAAIGVFTCMISTVFAVLSLEAEVGRKRRDFLPMIYIPLLAPQISFLFGVQVLWNRVGLDGSLFAVVWTHLLFVLPYVFLVLGDPYRAFDPRLAIAARTLGAGRWRTLLLIKAPLLARPIAIAAAIGFAVSLGQYLPTIFAGAGHIDTLATEAVALASGADRRLAGVVALTLILMPFLALLSAMAAGSRRGLAQHRVAQ